MNGRIYNFIMEMRLMEIHNFKINFISEIKLHEI